MEKLAGKVAVITGGGGGLGRSIALALAREGTHVVLGDVEVAAAEATAAEIRRSGARAIAAPADVADRSSVRGLADRVFGEFAEVHLLCNCAHATVLRPAVEMVDADWDRVMSVNLDGVINTLSAFLPRMVAQGASGHIINTCASTGLYSQQNSVSCATADYAVMGLTEHLKVELQPHGIGVSVLCLGSRNELEMIGRLTVRAIADGQLHILSEPNTRTGVEARYDRIRLAYSQ